MGGASKQRSVTRASSVPSLVKPQDSCLISRKQLMEQQRSIERLELMADVVLNLLRDRPLHERRDGVVDNSEEHSEHQHDDDAQEEVQRKLSPEPFPVPELHPACEEKGGVEVASAVTSAGASAMEFTSFVLPRSADTTGWEEFDGASSVTTTASSSGTPDVVREAHPSFSPERHQQLPKVCSEVTAEKQALRGGTKPKKSAACLDMRASVPNTMEISLSPQRVSQIGGTSSLAKPGTIRGSSAPQGPRQSGNASGRNGLFSRGSREVLAHGSPPPSECATRTKGVCSSNSPNTGRQSAPRAGRSGDSACVQAPVSPSLRSRPRRPSQSPQATELPRSRRPSPARHNRKGDAPSLQAPVSPALKSPPSRLSAMSLTLDASLQSRNRRQSPRRSARTGDAPLSVKNPAIRWSSVTLMDQPPCGGALCDSARAPEGKLVPQRRGFAGKREDLTPARLRPSAM
mmetsp:Transcript_61144/g.162453  ORF Transcript_61144/g.162453 Transcript_61144/m.162453 type:complete len:460 (-) Transcript_61144:463-1842(-)